MVKWRNINSLFSLPTDQAIGANGLRQAKAKWWGGGDASRYRISVASTGLEVYDDRESFVVRFIVFRREYLLAAI
jgi:hypothetical protein